MAVHQVQDHTRIERPTTRAHGQALHAAESHRRGDAVPVFHGAHAGPVAQVCNDRPSGCRMWVDVGKHRGDVFIGEAVETVAKHPFVRVLSGQREKLSDGWLGAVERGVEAGNLRQFRRTFGDDLDGGKVVGLVERHQGHELLEVRQNLAVDKDRSNVLQTTMTHSVTGCDNAMTAKDATAPPIEEELDRSTMPESGVGRPLLLTYHVAGLIASRESRLRQQTFELASDERLRGLMIKED